jgi:hypothetical protein
VPKAFFGFMLGSRGVVLGYSFNGYSPISDIIKTDITVSNLKSISALACPEITNVYVLVGVPYQVSYVQA